MKKLKDFLQYIRRNPYKSLFSLNIQFVRKLVIIIGLYSLLIYLMGQLMKYKKITKITKIVNTLLFIFPFIFLLFKKNKEPDPQKSIDIKGLKNIGNSCYMNSVLQIIQLLITRYKQQYAFQPQAPPLSISFSFETFYKALKSNRQINSISPIQIKNSMSRVTKTFDDNEQHDAYEWMISFLQQLHRQNLYRKRTDYQNQLKRDQAHESIIDDLFFGQYKTCYTCPVCSKQQKIFETFLAATVSIVKKDKNIIPTLQQCLFQFCTPEKCQTQCQNCYKKLYLSKQMTFQKINQIFIVKIERFRNQICEEILKVPEKITKTTLKSIGFEGQHSYQLIGMANHRGTLKSGHYTSIGKDQKGNWISFNDQVCKIIDKEIALEKSKTACLLFYLRQ